MSRARQIASRLLTAALLFGTGCVAGTDGDGLEAEAPLACRSCFCAATTGSAAEYDACIDTSDPAGTYDENPAAAAEACRELDGDAALCRDDCGC
ncbi:MAG TPA: hypothetical protein RMH85_01745 [Polyangiaceae bacterium LLY-WYZ-15_(1-7)]|nr:hypothetical protein [Sandaracinus sp.]HJK94848.1 hypothetical protein [Polyangiaceae bacterium LLY-WYZ-15_(1-7)]MBJ73954.1 hypothetical protein [Sandaracinus sp.]HJL00592.1 hypothetical protein [Polyangiaceae bacterium LLY-WYZ-15_(1-7)]HJL07187.1 hypothetical protein [Polyangiaceae bacterium LLY-WYZ-15_(1-7)]|tara:strand:- start:175 stop:459 length:285 start_codon:yes stop_codon:yes gene_type:complete